MSKLTKEQWERLQATKDHLQSLAYDLKDFPNREELVAVQTASYVVVNLIEDWLRK